MSSAHPLLRPLHRVHRFGRAHPRLIVAAVAGTAVGLLLPAQLAGLPTPRFIVGWNVFALLYLAIAGRMIAQSPQCEIQRRAARQDDGRMLVLVLGLLASVAVLMAVGSQLAAVGAHRDKTPDALDAAQKALHVGLAALTVVSGWFVTQVLFALHYAHEFFSARQRGEADPLQFPGGGDPGYADFLYFACIIGTSAQTADVALASRRMRSVGLVHCIQAFFFNTTVRALTINIAAGLFSTP